jgi:hypothetical protein
MNPILIDVFVTPGALALLEPLEGAAPVDPAGVLVGLVAEEALFDELLQAASTAAAPISATATRR